MKMVTVVVNFIFLIFVVSLIASKGIPDLDDNDFWIFVLFVLTPSINIVYILKNSGASKNKNFISLFFHRKMLEEQQKIDKIKSNQ